MKRIKPWMVAVTLTVVAAGGATTIFFVADAQHDRDRADITAWRQTASPLVLDAERILDGLKDFSARPVGEIGSVVEESLSRLRQDERTLIARVVPEILRPVTSEYAAAMLTAIEGVLALKDAISDGTLRPDENLKLSSLWTRAQREFASAAATLRELVCNARLPDCSG